MLLHCFSMSYLICHMAYSSWSVCYSNKPLWNATPWAIKLPQCLLCTRNNNERKQCAIHSPLHVFYRDRSAVRSWCEAASACPACERCRKKAAWVALHSGGSGLAFPRQTASQEATSRTVTKRRTSQKGCRRSCRLWKVAGFTCGPSGACATAALWSL